MKNTTQPHINARALAQLGIQKERVTKTIFKLDPHYADLLHLFADSLPKMTIRKTLDSLAEIAKEQKKHLPNIPPSDKAQRKSYSISEEAKNIFEDLAETLGRSRDNVLQGAIKSLSDFLKEQFLPPEKKIQLAKIIENYCDRLRDILHSEEFKEFHDTMDRLKKCGDADFDDISTSYAYLDHLIEQAVYDFIEKKKNEIGK